MNKLESIAHYVIARCDDPRKLGAIKLNKIIFFTDLYHYISEGKPLTETKYVKRQFGPVPQDILPTLSKLQLSGLIDITSSNFHGYQKTDYVSKQEPDLTNLDKKDIDLVNIVMSHVCEDHTATSISDATHDVVWHAADIGEEIPLSAFLVAQPGTFTEKDFSWATEVIEKRVYA